MTNQLKMAGSQGKPLNFVPIYTSRFFQGLWTQRNPLRSGAIGWQVEKAYGVNNDCLIDGRNTEIGTRLTLIRRPGTSIYNDQDFPAILSFYSFRLFNTASQSIKVIADTASVIYDATGPSTKQPIYTKTVMDSRARFQSVGNILYFGDGAVDKKWIQSLNTWQPSTTYNVGEYFIDTNGNIQGFTKVIMPNKVAGYQIASTSYTGVALDVRVYGGGLPPIPEGTIVSLSGLTTHPELNGEGGSVITSGPVTPYTRSFVETGSQQVTDNVLTVKFALASLPGPVASVFPVGASVTFKGIIDSVEGGGGIILSSTLEAPSTAVITVAYVHPDYGVSLNSVTDLNVFYGDFNISLNSSLVSPAWTDTADTGTLSVGAGGSSLANIGLVSLSSDVLTLHSGVGGYVDTFNPGVTVTFAGFTDPLLTFLNSTTGVVLSNTLTDLICAYPHTDVFPAVLNTAAATATAAATTMAPAAITNVTIAAGVLTCACVNTFSVGTALVIAGCATATELNGLQLVVATRSGVAFTAMVPLPDRASTGEGAATAQEVSGFISIYKGVITVTQPNSYQVGQSVLFSGLTNADFLNGQTIVVKNASPYQYSGDYADGTAKITAVSVLTNVGTFTANNQYTVGQVLTLDMNLTPAFPTEVVVASATSSSFTAAFTYGDTGTTPVGGCYAYLKFTEMADTGGTSTATGNSGSAVSGTTQPNFNNLAGSSVLDGNIQWTNHGTALQKMGIDGPVLAPSVSTVVGASAPAPIVAVWKANAYFGQASTSAVTIVDNSAGPYLQVVTQAGFTDAVQPAWNVALNGTTADGSVTWTNKGILGRIANHAYQIGDRIAVVNYYMQVFAGYTGNPNAGGQPRYNTVGPFSSFFTCTEQGTTANVSSKSIKWTPSSGQAITDGSVTWSNSGSLTLWPGALVDLTASGFGSIVDTNGNTQNVLTAGITGATQPTWAKTQGATTKDGAVTWMNAGPAAGGTDTTTDQVEGKWYYGFAYKNSFTNEVSNMSPISEPVIPGAGTAVSISGPGPTDPQVDTIMLFRTLQGGSTFFWLAEASTQFVSGGSWTYLDASPDPPAPNATMNLLITAAVNYENSPAPTGTTNLAFHLNRLWGSVGNVVVFSNPPGFSIGASYTQFPPLNYFTFPSKVIRLWPLGTAGILVFTVSDIYIITGTTTAAFSPAPFLKGVGLLNYDALSIMGSIICMFTTDGQLITLDPNSGVTEVGFPIGNLLNASFNPLTSYVSWHASGSQDKALYVADGFAGWHRLSLSASPESGLMWSPYAEIVGGTSAVQSVEVSPGVVRLLIGS